MSKVVLKGYIIVADKDLSTVKQELENHKKLTRAEKGCLVFEVNQNKDNPNRFDVYEEFTNKQAFETHQARVKSSDWGRVSANAERHYEISN